MRKDSITIHVQWCKFTVGEDAYAYTLHVNDKYIPRGGKFPTVAAALEDALEGIRTA